MCEISERETRILILYTTLGRFRSSVARLIIIVLAYYHFMYGKYARDDPVRSTHGSKIRSNVPIIQLLLLLLLLLSYRTTIAHVLYII